MLLVGFFSWWYGAGWRDQFSRLGASLDRVNDYFSVPLLLRTLFKPFRQISAGETGRDLKEKFQVALDKLFSRLIGAFMRVFLIIAGVLSMIFVIILDLIKALVWPFFPLLPLFGLVLMFSVGVPWII